MDTTTDTKKFNFRNKRALLTYKTHLDKREYFKWLNKKCGVKSMIIGHETGDEECEYLHTHVLVEFNKRPHWSSQRCLDYEGVHPHIKTLPNKKAFKDAYYYVRKEDLEPYEFGIEDENIVETILQQTSLRTVLEKTSIRNVTNVMRVWEAKPKIEIEDRLTEYKEKMEATELRPYQQEWMDEIERQNDRQILWIWDKRGNIGKTWFRKRLAALTNDVFLATNKTADNAFRYQFEKYVIFDFPRCNQEITNYGAIEEMKNCCMATGKYQGAQKVGQEPKVIVFANFYPKIRELSLDRWVIIEVVNQGSELTNIKDGQFNSPSGLPPAIANELLFPGENGEDFLSESDSDSE